MKILTSSISITGVIVLMLTFFTSCEKGPNFRQFELPDPVITDFSPKQGYAGEEITITGANFGDIGQAVKVYFGGVEAPAVVSCEDNRIVIKAPEEGISGTVAVKVYAKSITSAESFEFLPAAKIEVISTDRGETGNQVTITGKNFGVDISELKVFIGEAEAEISSFTETEITFTIPDAKAGELVLHVGRQRISGGYFLIGDALVKGTLIGHSGSFGNNPATTIAAAVDGNLDTFVDGPAASGFVGYDYGTGKAANITLVRYAPRSTHASRMVGGEIRGANDPSLRDYVVLHKITEQPAVGEYTEVSLSDKEAYRYVYYHTAAGNCNIAEIEFYGNIIDQSLPIGKIIWEFDTNSDNQGWVPTNSASWIVADGKMTVTYPQATGKKRADLQQTQLPVVLHTGNYPIVAIKFNKGAAQLTFDTNRGAVGGGGNRYKTDFVTQDVYYYDLKTQAIGGAGILADQELTFSTFQFKIADVPEADPAKSYTVEWIRTFKDAAELEAFLK